MEVDCGFLSALELHLPDLAVDRVLLIDVDPFGRDDPLDLVVTEVVLLVEAKHWLVGEVLRGLVVVLPRSVALVELDEDEDHQRHHCEDDSEVDQKGSAYA